MVVTFHDVLTFLRLTGTVKPSVPDLVERFWYNLKEMIVRRSVPSQGLKVKIHVQSQTVSIILCATYGYFKLQVRFIILQNKYPFKM